MGSEAKQDDDLKNRLTDEQYRVTQEKATERPFTGRWLDNKEDGVRNRPAFVTASIRRRWTSTTQADAIISHSQKRQNQ